MDRMTRRFAETRTISITQVDMTNHLVQGRDQYGTLLQVSWHLSDAITSVPAIGETWTVERQGNLWFLDQRGDDGTESTSLKDLGPGDRRIDTSGNIYLNGDEISLNGNEIFLNGSNLFVNGNQYIPGATPGLLGAKPLASAVPSGSMYYATDQDVMYLNTGAAWTRLGLPAGATLMWFSSAIPTGWVKYDGTLLPASTGIYADLAGHLGGTTTPNTKGRMPVGQGSHPDVSTIGSNDGLTESSRRPKHKHTVVQPTISTPSISVTQGSVTIGYQSFSGGSDIALRADTGTGGNATYGTAGVSATSSTPSASGGTVGPQTGAEPTDGAAWITTVFIAKL